jgi:hypothetical protein
MAKSATGVVDMGDYRKAHHIRPTPRLFRVVAAHLASIEQRQGTADDKRVVSEEIGKKIDVLAEELAQGGELLRRGVTSHILTMTGGASDPISPAGVRFVHPGTGATITINPGEAAAKGGANVKIDRIVQGCITAAESDLALLRQSREVLESGGTPSADNMSGLKDILGGNSYWRFLKSL